MSVQTALFRAGKPHLRNRCEVSLAGGVLEMLEMVLADEPPAMRHRDASRQHADHGVAATGTRPSPREARPRLSVAVMMRKDDGPGKTHSRRQRCRYSGMSFQMSTAQRH